MYLAFTCIYELMMVRPTVRGNFYILPGVCLHAWDRALYNLMFFKTNTDNEKTGKYKWAVQ